MHHVWCWHRSNLLGRRLSQSHQLQTEVGLGRRQGFSRMTLREKIRFFETEENPKKLGVEILYPSTQFSQWSGMALSRGMESRPEFLQYLLAAAFPSAISCSQY